MGKFPLDTISDSINSFNSFSSSHKTNKGQHLCHAQGMWRLISRPICPRYAKGNHLRLILYRLRPKHFLESNLGDSACYHHHDILWENQIGQILLETKANGVVIGNRGSRARTLSYCTGNGELMGMENGVSSHRVGHCMNN